ncbi:M15 family metallopeptidase [Clostridium sp. AL.422]|uniref:M15 family metallopeptidase n=1 Tax=Clostridium TaxID=1485 RepID=UPI00293DA94E|nr:MULTISPECIES: M15 family metallopeptidase [unclassified Clostridium]MDV4151743.1 M15 family metallopeptidase [Clostridium sp. AL.422]
MAKVGISKRIERRRKMIRRIRRMILLVGIIFIFSTIIVGKYIKKQSISDDQLNVLKDETKSRNETIDVNNNLNNILLVNKDVGLEREYEPEDLEIVSVKSNKEILLRKEANESLEEMFKDAKRDGLNLLAVSGYRTYEYQENVYINEVYTNGREYADKYVAKPGYSEHQTGLSVDILAADYTNMDENFENTKECEWLHENMSKYGFILRYPKNKESITGYNYEPWHIRYVGTEHSLKIEEEGLTLEEYLGQ